MRRATMVLALVGAAGLVCAACSDDGPSVRPDGGQPPTPDTTTTPDDGGGPPPGKELSFVKRGVDLEKAGEYTSIASGGGVIGVAYYRALENKDWPSVECPKTFSGGGGSKPRPGHDVYYVESSDGGGEWSTPVKVAQTIIASPFGLSLAIAPDGTRHVGYLGGETMSMQECSSNDAVISSSSDGQSWTPTTVFAAGDVGDTVGYWMSVAVDPAGQARAVYRDVGFGLYEAIGHEKSEARYDTAGEAIDGESGNGHYNILRFDTAGNPVVMTFNPMRTDALGGIQVARRKGSWQSQQVLAGGFPERPAFDTDGNGVWGLAFQDDGSLKYIESTDLDSWTQPLTVDLSTTTNGQYAAMAFDSQGNPAISYYRCGPAAESKCSPGQDGLMLAYRIDGKWKTWEVDDGKEFACGDQTSLTFNSSDEPVISYRCVTLRNADNAFVDTLKVARGVWK